MYGCLVLLLPNSIFNTGFSWLQSWEECAKQTCLQHGVKACVEDWASGGSQTCAENM